MTRSVSRAIAILETVAHHPDGIGVNEIARQTDLHKSTVSRLLMTLEDEQMVERLDAGFGLGARLQQMAQPDQSVGLVGVIRPFLHTLCTQIGEDIGLAVPLPDGVRYVVQIRSPQRAVQVRDWTGSAFDYHATSSGKLMMAYWPEARLDAYLKRPLFPFSPNTLTDPAKIRSAIATIRQQQCDWTQDEFAADFSAVSAPIFDNAGQVQAAINIYAPTFRFPKRHKAEITEQLLAVCRQVTGRVGGTVEMFEEKVKSNSEK